MNRNLVCFAQVVIAAVAISISHSSAEDQIYVSGQGTLNGRPSGNHSASQKVASSMSRPIYMVSMQPTTASPNTPSDKPYASDNPTGVVNSTLYSNSNYTPSGYVGYNWSTGCGCNSGLYGGPGYWGASAYSSPYGTGNQGYGGYGYNACGAGGCGAGVQRGWGYGYYSSRALDRAFYGFGSGNAFAPGIYNGPGYGPYSVANPCGSSCGCNYGNYANYGCRARSRCGCQYSSCAVPVASCCTQSPCSSAVIVPGSTSMLPTYGPAVVPDASTPTLNSTPPGSVSSGPTPAPAPEPAPAAPTPIEPKP